MPHDSFPSKEFDHWLTNDPRISDSEDDFDDPDDLEEYLDDTPPEWDDEFHEDLDDEYSVEYDDRGYPIEDD